MSTTDDRNDPGLKEIGPDGQQQSYRLPQAHVQQCDTWGPMKWSGWITEGPMRSGNWYAATRRGIERKMRRALRRRDRERAWREACTRVLPSGGSDE